MNWPATMIPWRPSMTTRCVSMNRAMVVWMLLPAIMIQMLPLTTEPIAFTSTKVIAIVTETNSMLLAFAAVVVWPMKTITVFVTLKTFLGAQRNLLATTTLRRHLRMGAVTSPLVWCLDVTIPQHAIMTRPLILMTAHASMLSSLTIAMVSA